MTGFILFLLVAGVFGLVWWVVGLLCKREETRLVAEAEAMRPVNPPRVIEREYVYPHAEERPTRTLTGIMVDNTGGTDPAAAEFFNAAMNAAIMAGRTAEEDTQQLPVEVPLPMEEPVIPPTRVYVDQHPTPEAEPFVSVPAAPPAFPAPDPDPVVSSYRVPTVETPSYTSIPDSSPSYSGGDSGGYSGGGSDGGSSGGD